MKRQPIHINPSLPAGARKLTPFELAHLPLSAPPRTATTE